MKTRKLVVLLGFVAVVHVTIGAVAKLSLRKKLPDAVVGSLALESRGVPVGAPNSIPQGEVLPIVVLKEEVVVRVVGGAIDDLHQLAGDPVVTVVDGHGPDIDKDVQTQVENFVQGEKEGVDVVGKALQEAIHRMESMAGKRCWDFPHVVGLVEVLVNQPVMEKTVDPIDAHVSKKQEGDHTENQSRPTKCKVVDTVIKFAVSSDLSKEQGHRGYADTGQRTHGILNLSSYLVRQKLRVFHQVMVKDKVVAETAQAQV